MCLSLTLDAGVVLADAQAAAGTAPCLLPHSKPNTAMLSVISYTSLRYRMAGRFSAEHGVGGLKRNLLARYGDPLGLALMRQLKSSFDPFNLMNPGKLMPAG